MKEAKIVLTLFCGLALLGTLSEAVAGVPIGSSSLIQVLDYSDTFTTTDNGGLPDREIGWFPLSGNDYPENGTPGEGLAVENCYGNPQRYWGNDRWSINTDATFLDGSVSFYPGGSGSGSDTGITQTGGAYSLGWGVEYAGLRDRFVVQFDAVQNPGWVAIFFGSQPDTWWHEDNTALLMRTAGDALGEVGVFTIAQEIYEKGTDLFSPVYYANEWHNYAALIDLTARTVEVFIDEVSLGTIDFNTLAEGAFADVSLTSLYVGAAYNGGDRMWTDNFQIGSPDLITLDPIPGDANGDRNVDAEDAKRLATHWGATTQATGLTWWQMGDFNGDNVVDALDAAILAAQWGNHTGSESATATAVPEPGIVSLLAIALIGFGFLRRCK